MSFIMCLLTRVFYNGILSHESFNNVFFCYGSFSKGLLSRVMKNIRAEISFITTLRSSHFSYRFGIQLLF